MPEFIDSAAYFIGYAVISLSTIAVFLGLVGAFLNYKWRKIKDVMAWQELQEAFDIAVECRNKKGEQ